MLPGYYVNNSYDKYLNYTLENSNVSEVDIFELYRSIVSCIGREPKITSQGNGSLLIEAQSPEESEKLQKLTSFQGMQAHCNPHVSLNHFKGVIY